MLGLSSALGSPSVISNWQSGAGVGLGLDLACQRQDSDVIPPKKRARKKKGPTFIKRATNLGGVTCYSKTKRKKQARFL